MMNENNHYQLIAKALNISTGQVGATVSLLDDEFNLLVEKAEKDSNICL